LSAVSLWHWLIILMLSGSLGVGPAMNRALSEVTDALRMVADLPSAKRLLDYSPDGGGLVLYRLPGNACFLRSNLQLGQTSWIRRDDQGRIEITVSAPGLARAGRSFDPADGTARLQLGGKPVAVPVASPGAPTWRFTLDDTPALQAALDADTPKDLSFTAIRGGKPVPDETLAIATADLFQGLQGLDSCAIGAELPGVVGP
jgi:hypothetical protein